MPDDPTRTELNRLYWESDTSVADIAERLGISRRALYDGIEPRPAGASCPECGGDLGFRNRTTAQAGEAECADCGFETAVEPGSEAASGAAAERGRAATANRPERRRRPPLTDGAPRRIPTSGNGPLLGGSLLAGMAIGAVAGYFIRRH